MPATADRAPWSLRIAAALAATAVLAILGFLVWFCRPVFEGTTDVWTWEWRPFHGHHGILPMIVGTVLLSVSALLLALPTAIAISAFAHGLGPRPLAAVVMAFVRFLTGVPTIVYAFVSAILLVPIVRETFERGTGYSLLTGALVLAALVTPTIVLVLDASWRLRAPDLRLTCDALGIERSSFAWSVLLPATRRSLFAAGLLGFARAAGDTMIALLLTGNAPRVPETPLDATRTLTAHVGLVFSTSSGDPAYASIFAAGLLLLLLTAAASLAVRGLRRRPEPGRASRA